MACAWVDLALLVVEFLVGYGLINASEPLLAWVYAFLLGPALLLTLAGATLGRATGRPWGPARKLLAFFGGVALTIVLGAVAIVLLVVSAIIAVLNLCFGGG